MAAHAAAIGETSEFDQSVQSFLNTHCADCHGAKKQKGEFRLDTLSRNFVLGGSANHWAEVMDRISSGEMPPEDEPRPKPEEAAKIVDWLASKLHEGESSRLARRERVTLHKLTRDEYANTVHDLLGVRFDPADPTGLSEDETWHGFERIGSVLSLSPSHVEKYFAAAESILTEAFPVKKVEKFFRHTDAIDLRGGPIRAVMEEQGIADKVRVDLWAGSAIINRAGPGRALPVAGDYKVRIKLSGLKPAGGRAPHVVFYATDLDRVLYEQDVVASEDQPVVLEFQTHLPAGNIGIRLINDVPGPPNVPRSGRADPRIPFISLKDGRRPWQMKLTDEAGLPIAPFLIIDWVEWEGPFGHDGPTFAQREYWPTEKGNFDQARAGLARFAERAFRRPVGPDEADQFVQLLQREIGRGESFEAAMRTGLLAIMCSKDFLYLVEGSAGENAPLVTPWELASRLSYFLWSTMPDTALLAAARDGSLRRPEVLRAQVRRMLADPRAARFTETFPREWLQLRTVGMFPPDKKLYPDYDAYLEKSMVRETTAYFREVLERNLDLREFLDSNWTMLNARLAQHYQIPDVIEDRFRRVALRPEDHRGGILTHASVLSLTSDGFRHRPVHRGKWVLESIIGKPPPPPPANVVPLEPTPPGQPKATLRLKLDAHKADPSCASCHRKIDPLGFAFDNYDAVGRWRTEETVSDGSGQNPLVDASGELVDGRKFGDVATFKKLLVADVDKFNAVFVEKLATFALRRATTIDDRRDLASLVQQSKEADYRLPAIIEALVASDLFQKR